MRIYHQRAILLEFDYICVTGKMHCIKLFNPVFLDAILGLRLLF